MIFIVPKCVIPLKCMYFATKKISDKFVVNKYIFCAVANDKSWYCNFFFKGATAEKKITVIADRI